MIKKDVLKFSANPAPLASINLAIGVGSILLAVASMAFARVIWGFVSIPLAAIITFVSLRIAIREYNAFPCSPAFVIFSIYGLGTLPATCGYFLAPNMMHMGEIILSDSTMGFLVFKALVLTALSLVIFWACFFIGRSERRHWNGIASHKQPSSPVWLSLIAVLGTLGTLSGYIFIQKRGGLVNFINFWNRRDMGSEGIFEHGLYALPVACLIACYFVRTQKWMTYLLAGMVAAASVVLFSTGSRFELLRFYLALFIIASLHAGTKQLLVRRWYLVAIGAGTFFFLYLFGVGAMRGLAGNEDIGGARTYQMIVENAGAEEMIAQNLSFYYLPSPVTFASMMGLFPDIHPFLRGESILAAADIFVPSFLYDGFPELRIGKLIYAQFFGYDAADSSLYANWQGEWYANFGFKGVLLGMALLGLMCRVLDSVMRARACTDGVIIFCTILMAIYLPMLQTVEMLNASFYSVIYIIAGCGIALLLRTKSF